jgi:hypothetical protein
MKKLIALFASVVSSAVGFSDEGLKALYRFEEKAGKVAIDSSANANHAELMNQPLRVEADGLNVMAFEGDRNTFLNCGNGSALSGKTDFTLSAWIKTSSRHSGCILHQRTFLDKAQISDAAGSYSFLVNGSGELLLSLSSVGKKNNLLKSTLKVNDNQWHFVTAVRKNGTARLFVDGLLEQEKKGLNIALNNLQPVIIGAQGPTTPRYFFDGLMDDVAIHSRALSLAEINFYANVRGYMYNGDADADGLSNGFEFEHQLDMTEADIDGDGLTDAQEIELGTDPLVYNGHVKTGFELHPIGAVDDYTAAYDKINDSHSFSVRSSRITGKSDSFLFISKPLAAHSRLTVKLHNYTDVSSWSKVGVMIRDSYAADSPYAFTFVSGKNGAGMAWRKQTGDTSAQQLVLGSRTMWLSIVCHQGRVTSYVSDDLDNTPLHWVKIAEQQIHFNAQTRVGLAVASGNRKKAVKVTLSNLEVTTSSDLDGDGLTDWEEQQVEHTNALFADSENDGLNDHTEISDGTHPNFAATTLDGKTFHRRGLISKYFKGIYDRLPEFAELPLYASGRVDQIYFAKTRGKSVGGPLNDGAASFSGKIHIPRQGHYTFYTQSDDGSKLYINDRLIVDNDARHRDMQERSGVIHLAAGFHDIKIDYFDAGYGGGLKLLWKGPDFAKTAIPAAVLIHAQSDYTQAVEQIDRDGDGLTDISEASFGTNPLKQDSNGDGLTDFEKYKLGLNPLKTDSDGDGVSDFMEVKTLKSNPLAMEFDGTSQPVASMEGRTAVVRTGKWQTNGSSIYCDTRRGEISFTADLPKAEIYKLAFDVNDYYGDAYQTEFDVYLNGTLLGSPQVKIRKGKWTRVQLFTPYLKSGVNELTLSWDNAYSGRSVQISKVDFLAMGGADANHNGTKDWVEYVVSQHNTLSIPALSKVSPVQVTGRCRYPALTDHAEMVQLANGRVILPVTLKPNQPTDLTVSFENGGRSQAGTIAWAPTDIEQDSHITILQGQSLLLTAGTVNQQTPATIDGSKVTEPLVKRFDTVGTFTVTAVKADVSSTITVKVLPKYEYVDANGHEKFIACRQGQRRLIDWAALGLTAADELEVDDNLGFAQYGTQLKITIDGNCTRFITVKDKASGVIRGRIRLEGFQTYGIAQTSMYQLKIDESGAYHFEMPLIVNRSLPGLTHKIKIRLAGVVLDDGSTLKEITADMLDNTGMIKQLFIKTEAARKTAGCHYLDMYQDGVKFGRIY